MSLLIEQAYKQNTRTAIISGSSHYTYADLIKSSEDFAALLLKATADLQEERVAYMVNPGFDYVKVQWAIWRAGGVAVPLCISHPLPSIQYVLEDTAASIVVVEEEYEEMMVQLKGILHFRLIVINKLLPISSRQLPRVSQDRRAMILYTSGTTNKPKGVVTSHKNIDCQIKTLVDAWQWSTSDHIFCVLPLHHVHGIINVVSCALWSGAQVEFVGSFSEERVFEIIEQGRVNVFMAVPTIYYKMIAYWDRLPLEKQIHFTQLFSKFRLMVSGSAALPVSTFEKWKMISNHSLLERYGMTEIGMGISNPYIGERKPGYIGWPLPGVNVRLVNETGEIVNINEAGEIQIKGDNVFLEYWNKPTATKDAFTEEGWFKTGDIAIVENGYYKILGRDSIDIIKSGGYKISALEIEEHLREYSTINDCSVIGIPDAEWGEIIAAVILTGNSDINFDEIKTWLRSRIPAYKVPRLYKIVSDLPKNAMGKVVKKELRQYFV